MSFKHPEGPKLNFILGTAAELIKVYPLIYLAHKRGLEYKILSTGQARENFLMQYRDFRLDEKKLESILVSHGDLDRAASAIKWFFRAIFLRPAQLEPLFLTGSNAYAIVHGDTLSTLVGAWLGYRLGLRVAHVEAGLRSPKLFQPFPEEITRRCVSQLARLHFAPNRESLENLTRAKARGMILDTQGNTLKDACWLAPQSPYPNPPAPYALANLHRFENLNSSERWQQLIDTTVKAAERIKVIFVMHPQTKYRLEGDQKGRERLLAAGVVLRDRMSFSQFLTLLKGAEFLISDGGSNQEECSYLDKPCLLLREATERPEGLDGPCVLSKFSSGVIDEFLNDWRQFKKGVTPTNTSPSTLILEALQNA